MILDTERLMRFARARAFHDRRARAPRKTDDEIMRVLAAFVRALARAAGKTITVDSRAIDCAITAYRLERGTAAIAVSIEESQMALLMAAQPLKPFTHAQIAAGRYGGTAMDWLPYHDWWDRSKAAFPSMQHRMFLHSELGIHWFLQKHGVQLVVADGALEARAIAEDHMIEDVGFVPSVETWLETLPAIPTGRPSRPLRALRSDRLAGAIERWGGTASDYERVFGFFDSPLLFTEDPRALALSHNSFALFILEELVGPVLTIAGREIATRTIGEDLIIARYGHIPFPSALSRFHLAPWMRGARVPDALRHREG